MNLISFDDFIDKYNSKFVEYHSYGTGALNQCIDLVNQYFVEVLGVPAIIGTNAVDVPSKVSPDDFTYIKNTPTGIPLKGDIIVWSGLWGHIAIFYEGDVNSFTSFDQNFPTGSPCHLQGHSYEKVIGWLHPRKEIMSDALTECLNQHTKLVDEAIKKDKQIQSLVLSLESCRVDINNKDKQIINLQKEKNEEIIKLNKEKEAINQKLEELTERNKEILNQNETLEIENEKLEGEIEELESDIISNVCEYDEPIPLIDRLKSRKLWLAILGSVVLPVVNKVFNLNLSIGEIFAILTPILAYIGVEGVKDIVK